MGIAVIKTQKFTNKYQDLDCYINQEIHKEFTGGAVVAKAGINTSMNYFLESVSDPLPTSLSQTLGMVWKSNPSTWSHHNPNC